jgi:NhaA family Na+:H+ antiporter
MVSAATQLSARLRPPLEAAFDHISGAPSAAVALVEFGSYACPSCRAANGHIEAVRARLGARLRVAFRHRPLPDSDLAWRAAELVECAQDEAAFWRAHGMLMTRSDTLTEDDLRAVSDDLGLGELPEAVLAERLEIGRTRIARDMASARASGVSFTPTFFVNGRRYDGPWDEASLVDAMLGSLGHRLRMLALGLMGWAPATGLALILATLLAIVLFNTPLGPAFARFWETPLAFSLGDAAFSATLGSWVNDALLTFFFLVVGLEIKREFTVGALATRRAAALPIAAAIGGMVFPALVYALLIPAGWARGWGVPMATDTAFALALIAMLGTRVPTELRVFLTAAAIVDDIGAILVVAFFYTGGVHWPFLVGALAPIAGLVLLRRAGVYRVWPYMALGVLLWVCLHDGGVHATMAGVILAAFIPTRPPPDYTALAAQADTILATEARRAQQPGHIGPSEAALRTLDQIHDRLESPAERVLRRISPRSAFLVLPIFALANAGIRFSPGLLQGREPLVLAIVAALVLGKPAGFLGATALAVRLGLAEKPSAYSWRQLGGAGALAGIGFTMSLFIAGQSFTAANDFAAAKVAVFAASLLAALLGVAALWTPSRSVGARRNGSMELAPPAPVLPQSEPRASR